MIDRDTKHPEVFRLAGRQYLAVAADREGWVTSQVLGARFRPVAGPHPAVEDLADAALHAEI